MLRVEHLDGWTDISADPERPQPSIHKCDKCGIPLPFGSLVGRDSYDWVDDKLILLCVPCNKARLAAAAVKEPEAPAEPTTFSDVNRAPKLIMWPDWYVNYHQLIVTIAGLKSDIEELKAHLRTKDSTICGLEYERDEALRVKTLAREESARNLEAKREAEEKLTAFKLLHAALVQHCEHSGLSQVIAAERERCAKIAEEYYSSGGHDYQAIRWAHGNAIAAKIREG
jgi:hypothetical protein